MLAIVETCGKQYEIQEGRYVDVELLGKEENEIVELDKVVMIVAGDQSQVGQPYVEGAVVKAKVIKNDKDKKIIVYKQRCKKGYRRKNGHRQQFCRIMIESIDFPGKADVVSIEQKAEEIKATEKAKAEKAAAKAKKEKEAKPKKTTAKKAVKAEAISVAEEKKETKKVATKKAPKKESTEVEVQEVVAEEVQEEAKAEVQETSEEEKSE